MSEPPTISRGAATARPEDRLRAQFLPNAPPKNSPGPLLSNDQMSPLFLAAIEATEEAIYNSLFMATTVTGNGHSVEALTIDNTVKILKKYQIIK